MWDRVQNALSLQQLSVPGRKITSQKHHVTSVRLPLFAPSFQQHRGRIYSTEDPISHKQHCQNTSTYCYWQIKKEKKSVIFHQPTFSGIQEGIHYFFFRWLGRWLIYPLTGFLDSLSRTLRGNVKDYEIQKMTNLNATFTAYTNQLILCWNFPFLQTLSTNNPPKE